MWNKNRHHVHLHNKHDKQVNIKGVEMDNIQVCLLIEDNRLFNVRNSTIVNRIKNENFPSGC